MLQSLQLQMSAYYSQKVTNKCQLGNCRCYVGMLK